MSKIEVLKAGDIVDHPTFGRCEIFEISHLLGYADINLIGQKVEYYGHMRNTYIVPIKELSKTTKPEDMSKIHGFEITINENGVEIASLPKKVLVKYMKEREALEAENKKLKEELEELEKFMNAVDELSSPSQWEIYKIRQNELLTQLKDE